MASIKGFSSLALFDHAIWRYIYVHGSRNLLQDSILSVQTSASEYKKREYYKTEQYLDQIRSKNTMHSLIFLFFLIFHIFYLRFCSININYYECLIFNNIEGLFVFFCFLRSFSWGLKGLRWSSPNTEKNDYSENRFLNETANNYDKYNMYCV